MEKKKDIEDFYKVKSKKYQHLKVIRDNLWSKDGKSRVSVMVGAGFSLNANKIEENLKGMALWEDLKSGLTEKLNHHIDIEYKEVLEIGQIYEDEYGRANLDEVLKEAIPDDNYEPDTLHYNFLNLPWSDIYTTNYDTLLERAKRQIYERKYQVVYDINDIPNSTSPRIIKLHGSFPSNRPFIFTENDYKYYPEKYSPFVNMVQQSIMETTFVLIGFSGDDPNFERWTTWVKNNLGEQMPKIYMIGYGQKKRLGYLKSKGITLIDFEDVYINEKNPYKKMYTDLFEFLEYKNREEKTKWPFRNYTRFNLSLKDLKYNREHFPGWIVMPDHIRRENAENLRNFGNDKIRSINSLNNQQDVEYINEVLWCFENFYIPLEFDIQKHLQSLVDKTPDGLKNHTHRILLSLLNQARFDCDRRGFFKFKNLLEKNELDINHRNRIIYEEILLDLTFNKIDEVNSKLSAWQVGEREVEWGIKKASILLNISSIEEAQEILEGYLQTIRSLLAIQGDDYRLLTSESIALHLLGKIYKERDYGYDRLNSLNLKNCNVSKEFNNMLISIKRYENELGTKETPGFDLGKGRVSSKMGDYFKQELLDSYAVLCVEEMFGITVKDKTQYDLALSNLEILFPLSSMLKRIIYLNLKDIDKVYSREYVYQIADSKLEVLVKVLDESIKQKVFSIINKEVALEIISRIYFALSLERKLEIDTKIVSLINNEGNLRNKTNTRTGFINLLQRIMFDKNKNEQKEFCEKLLRINVISQWQEEPNLYQHEFFDPFLIVFAEKKEIFNISISEKQVIELLEYLKEDNDKSIKESALIRLTFLAETNSLPDSYRKDFVEILKTLPKTNAQGISDFIFNNVFDKIINLSLNVSANEVEDFLAKDIPKFYSYVEEFKTMGYSSNAALTDYVNEIYGVFPDYVGRKTKSLPDKKYYKKWLLKFYSWWDDQEIGLLRDIRESRDFLPLGDHLKTVVICLKNNILSVAPIAVFDKNDLEKLSYIFKKIEGERPDLSFYLIPSFERLAIPTNYSVQDLIKGLKSKEEPKIQIALLSVYEYLILIEYKEIKLNTKILKDELFLMLYYCSGDIFKSTVDTFAYILKNTSIVFNEEDCIKILDFLNDFLNLITSKKITLTKLKDFEVISSVTRLVAHLSQCKFIYTSGNLNDWAVYIKNHRLPEVRKYSDYIELK